MEPFVPLAGISLSGGYLSLWLFAPVHIYVNPRGGMINSTGAQPASLMPDFRGFQKTTPVHLYVNRDKATFEEGETGNSKIRSGCTLERVIAVV
jgi:hypothetical protein